MNILLPYTFRLANMGGPHPLYIEVGKQTQGLEIDSPKETVIAIFDATVFLVVTERRGPGDTLPYFFSRTDVTRVIEGDWSQ